MSQPLLFHFVSENTVRGEQLSVLVHKTPQRLIRNVFLVYFFCWWKDDNNRVYPDVDVWRDSTAMKNNRMVKLRFSNWSCVANFIERNRKMNSFNNLFPDLINHGRNCIKLQKLSCEKYIFRIHSNANEVNMDEKFKYRKCINKTSLHRL